MLKGFWSYVRDDDEADGGRITQLARDVASQFEMITGERVELFIDRDAISWGDNWRTNIDDNLATTAFFVAVITPRFITSPECRRETTAFAKKARELGVTELFLPLLYVETPALHDDSTSDELVRLVRTHQWDDWTETRFDDRGSQLYRSGVHRLVTRLKDANVAAEVVAFPVQVAPQESNLADDEGPGLLDRLAQVEIALPDWNDNLGRIGAIITSTGSLMSRSSKEMETVGSKSFGARLGVARRTAMELAPLAEDLVAESNLFVAHLHDVDEGFRALISVAPAAVAADSSNAEAVCRFFEMVHRLTASAESGLGSFVQLAESMGPLEQASRDLRPPLRRLREGLNRLVEARVIMREWGALITASPVECSGANGSADGHGLAPNEASSTEPDSSGTNRRGADRRSKRNGKPRS